MHHRPILLGLALAAGLGALTGCGAAPDGEGALGTADQAIMGGYDDAKDKGVVDVLWMSEGAECSGSLLAPNMVLTAHHCVAPVNMGASGIVCGQSSFGAADTTAGDNFIVSTTEVLSMSATAWHIVSEVVTPPGGSSFCGQDQAIFILSDLVEPSEARPLVPRVDSQITLSEAYSAVGFGTTDDTTRRGPAAPPRRPARDVRRRRLPRPGPLHHPRVARRPRHLRGRLGRPGAGRGGPRDRRHLPRRVGLRRSDLRRRVRWASWIKSTALHAAEVGGYTAPAWATGYPTDPIFNFPIAPTASCSTASACASGLCLSDTEGSYCTRGCETAAPCPSGYSCEAVGAQQVCERVLPTPSTGKGSGCSVGEDYPDEARALVDRAPRPHGPGAARSSPAAVSLPDEGRRAALLALVAVGAAACSRGARPGARRRASCSSRRAPRRRCSPSGPVTCSSAAPGTATTRPRSRGCPRSAASPIPASRPSWRSDRRSWSARTAPPARRSPRRSPRTASPSSSPRRSPSRRLRG